MSTAHDDLRNHIAAAVNVVVGIRIEERRQILSLRPFGCRQQIASLLVENRDWVLERNRGSSANIGSSRWNFLGSNFPSEITIERLIFK
jgi:hypothetical protein